MTPLGLNETAFQGIVKANPNAFTFTDVFTATTDTTWGCSDGSIQHHYRNTILTSPIKATPIFNGSANKVTGWNLTGKGASVITENNTGGTRFPRSPAPLARLRTSPSTTWRRATRRPCRSSTTAPPTTCRTPRFRRLSSDPTRTTAAPGPQGSGACSVSQRRRRAISALICASRSTAAQLALWSSSSRSATRSWPELAPRRRLTAGSSYRRPCGVRSAASGWMPLNDGGLVR